MFQFDLDIQKKLLIVGDTVQLGPIYMFGEHRNLDLYIHSLEKLNTYQNQIERRIRGDTHASPGNVR